MHLRFRHMKWFNSENLPGSPARRRVRLHSGGNSFLLQRNITSLLQKTPRRQRRWDFKSEDLNMKTDL